VGRSALAYRKTRDERRKDQRRRWCRPCALAKLVSRSNCFRLNRQKWPQDHSLFRAQSLAVALVVDPSWSVCPFNGGSSSPPFQEYFRADVTRGPGTTNLFRRRKMRFQEFEVLMQGAFSGLPVYCP
jgi:hypothetical protein